MNAEISASTAILCSHRGLICGYQLSGLPFPSCSRLTHTQRRQRSDCAFGSCTADGRRKVPDRPNFSPQYLTVVVTERGAFGQHGCCIEVVLPFSGNAVVFGVELSRNSTQKRSGKVTPKKQEAQLLAVKRATGSQQRHPEMMGRSYCILGRV